MERSFESGRATVTFRPAGIGRLFAAAFLAFWLCGWAVGETFALSFLVTALLTAIAPEALPRLGMPAVPALGAGSWLVAAFLLVWLTFWTIGGLAAMRELLRLLWACDRLEYDGAGLRLVRRAGPFTRTREWAAGAIRDISLRRRDRALVLDDERRLHVLTGLGSRAEREALCAELRQALGLAGRARPAADDATLPEGWESDHDDTGALRLFRRRSTRVAQARAAWIATGAFATLAGLGLSGTLRGGAWGVGEIVAAGIVSSLLLLFAAGSARLSHGRADIVVHSGALEFRRRFLGRTHVETLRPVRLRVAHSVDSDGDEWFRLEALGASRARTLERAMNEPAPVVRLARWLSARGDAPLEIDRGVGESAAGSRAGRSRIH